VVDVLKIDTDGYEFDVLRGASKALSSCLVVETEVQFHGPVGPEANVFCNIDAHLRQAGFSLLKLDLAHYGRGALPRPFAYDIPAQTTGGPLAWADALYARDLADPNYEKKFDFAVSPERAATLALILDTYELEDMAAELVLAYPGLFGAGKDEGVLDILSTKLHGPNNVYRQSAAAFMRNIRKFA
jgi:hypothetical protein